MMRKIIVSIVIALIMVTNVCVADESGQFYSEVGASESYTISSEAFFTEYTIKGMYFDEVEYYQNLQSIRVGLIPGASIVNNDSINGASEPCIVTSNIDNHTIGEGSIGWGKVGADYYFYMYFDTWDVTGESGNTQYSIWYDEVELGLMIKYWGALGSVNSAEKLGLTYGGAGGRVIAANPAPQEYLITHSALFIHDYSSTLISGNNYRIDIDKNIDGKAFNSSIIINDSITTHLNVISSINETIITSNLEPLYLWVWDSNMNLYTYTFFAESTTQHIFKILDRSNNHIINNVSVTTYIDLDLYDINTYDSPFSRSYPDTVNIFRLGKSGYTLENQSLDLTLNTNHILYMRQIGIYADNTSTIYGNVWDYETNYTLSNALISLSNSSYSSNVYSNQYGYYEFGNLSNKTYNISVYLFEYNPSDLEYTIATLNSANLLDIYLSKTSALSTPTVRPTDTLGLPIYEQEDIYSFLTSWVFWIFLIILLLGGYVLYDRSGIRKIWGGK